MGNVYFQIVLPDFSLKEPVTKILGAPKNEVNNMLEKTKKVINEEVRKNRHLKDQKINCGYRRVHPLYGIQYIVQVTFFTVKKHHNNLTGETKTIYISHKRSLFENLWKLERKEKLETVQELLDSSALLTCFSFLTVLSNAVVYIIVELYFVHIVLLLDPLY